MSTYALFIATNPEPVSESDWTSLEQVYDRARLSSGGTRVLVRSASNGGHDAADYDTVVATFVNGIQLEIRDDGPEAFAFLGDGKPLGSAVLADGQWLLTADARVGLVDPEPVVFIPDAGHSRGDVERALSGFVEDWLETHLTGSGWNHPVQLG
ncbi:MAG: hypothetical protein J7513_17105 [Solirubrobacteraceae bacterium]|nr:hypothetical protein [Solirubrobacteraceae bacterium]